MEFRSKCRVWGSFRELRCFCGGLFPLSIGFVCKTVLIELMSGFWLFWKYISPVILNVERQVVTK